MPDTTATIVGRTVLATVCFAGAIALIIRDKGPGWGWLVLAGVIVAPGSMPNTESSDSA